MNSRFLPQLHDANDALQSTCVCDSERVLWRKHRVSKDCKCKYMLIVFERKVAEWWEATSLLKPRLNHDKTGVQKCIPSNPCFIPNLNVLSKWAKLGTIPWSRISCDVQTLHSLAPFDCLVMTSSLPNHQYLFKFHVDVLWKGSNFIVGCMMTSNTTNLESKTLQLQINTIPHKIENNLFVFSGEHNPKGNTLVSLEVNLYKLIMPPKNRMHLTPTKAS